MTAALSLENVSFDAPADFVQEEVVTSWRVPAKAVRDPMLAMHTQAEARPNMTMARVRVENPDLELHAAHTADQLVDRIKGCDGVRATYMEFADGATGILLEYVFPVMRFKVVQMQAMRIDGDVMTTLTICHEGTSFTDADRDANIRMLASIRIGGAS